MRLLRMKQTSRIISTYSADTFGVCSALFELGGMTVMHDASGCNSTYTTHDEPRWYDMDSMVYISGLSEMEAVLGDDEKLIGDIIAAARELHPRFIAVAGTPIPTMTGFDFAAVAEVIQRRTGIPAFGFPTTGMNTYVMGVSMALDALARRIPAEGLSKTACPSVNILGLTPLDFSVNGSDASIARFAEDAGFQVLSRWAMGSSLEEMTQAGAAHVNLVVSTAALAAAKTLKARFGTPYVVGVPIGSAFAGILADALHTAASTGEDQTPHSCLPGGDAVILGEGVYGCSLASALEAETGIPVRVICTTEWEASLLRQKDLHLNWETDLEEALKTAKTVIADPLFRPICPKEARWIDLPTEAFSGRIYRSRIPNLTANFEAFKKEVM